MDATELAVWAIAASLSLNAVFLRRLLAKLDKVYVWVCGTPDTPGISDRLARVESHLNLDPKNRRRGQ